MNPIIISQFIQIVLCVLIVVLILIQSKGKGLASAVGSSIGFYTARRGIERLVFIMTIVFCILLIANSLFIIVMV